MAIFCNNYLSLFFDASETTQHIGTWIFNLRTYKWKFERNKQYTPYSHILTGFVIEYIEILLNDEASILKTLWLIAFLSIHTLRRHTVQFKLAETCGS